MINILSYNGKPISGKEIKEWITFHTLNQTEHSRVAWSVVRFQNLADDRYYRIVLRPAGTGCGETKRYRPDVVAVRGNGKEGLM